MIRVVGAVIVNEENKILCAKRSSEMPLPGKWEFPGGKVEEDEDEKAALKREILEELHCDIVVGAKIAETIYHYTDKSVQLITYFANLVSGTPMANEHEKIVWLKREDLYSLDWAEADVPTVRELVNGVR